jgi:hypothetical protein
MSISTSIFVFDDGSDMEEWEVRFPRMERGGGLVYRVRLSRPSFSFFSALPHPLAPPLDPSLHVRLSDQRLHESAPPRGPLG